MELMENTWVQYHLVELKTNMKNMKTIILFTSILILIFFSFSARGKGSHLDLALQHAEAAVTSTQWKAVAEQAEMAKNHANPAKTENDQAGKMGSPHLDAGIRSLEVAIKEGQLGAADLARKAAEQAVAHLKKAE